MKKTRTVARCILALLLTVTVFSVIGFFCGYKVYRDVSYGEAEPNVMDIFIPKRAKKQEANGCVLMIHGGSWSSGDKKEEGMRCRYLANRGYVVAALNYTLHKEATASFYHVDTVLDEIDAALQKIKDIGRLLAQVCLEKRL